MDIKNFFNLPPQEVEQTLETNINTGLDDREVAERHNRYGYNEFKKQKRTSLLVKFLSQFKSFMIIVLLAAACISGVVGHIEGEGFTDAIIILAIVIINAVIGVAQEAKAEKSLEALEKLSSPQCKALRGGQVRVVESRDLVPGDIVILDTGDAVPADVRLVEAINIKVQESALTGESVPEDKFTEAIEGDVSVGDRDNMAFASSSVTYGRGKGIVTAIGMESEVGKIASMIQSVPDTKTPMQQKLDKLGKILGIAALSICAVIFLVGILYKRELLDMFMIAVSLAAAAIPEGLPAVSTIVLAVGVQRLVKRNAIVRKLPSVETLGSTQVICSDKTGTLTQNRMTVVKTFVDGAVADVNGNKAVADKELLIKIAILANDAKLGTGADDNVGDPTETALLDLGVKYNLVKSRLEEQLPRIAEVPFDSDRKLMSTVHRDSINLMVAVKGGVDELLARCTGIYDNGTVRELTSDDISRIAKANRDMAENALRVLAMATKQIGGLPEKVTSESLEKDLIFVGMVGMIDPPREEVKAAVEKCRSAGIKPVMITGDHRITAVAIAETLGIKQKDDLTMTGVEIENISDKELREKVNDISVYARVSPEHKVRIVRAFQANGNIVAMTGDGVNDAPALKLADIGVAMGITGTDVSKEAADVVLTDDNFATIVTAVEEGRRIYDNILKAIQFLLSTNIGEILVLFVAVIANWASPLLPIHILWINLVTDSLPALALSVDPADPNVMKRKPIDSRKGIMTRPFTIRIALQGLMVAALSLVAYVIGLKNSVEQAQTMTFAVLAFTQLTMIFGVRSGNRSALRGFFSNKYLLGAMALVTALMLAVLLIPAFGNVFHVVPLDSAHWLWVILLSIAPLPITDVAKLIGWRKR
ncbi:MAG: calcium-translocating P-type ATPase, PMCA-type [Cytophagaceae bacterium]|jgi:Ca2+-transporting ATPase|nr:calcium-translocating P-type ATPase, PMCA-type [Cytophagaceae bacterium]